MAKYFCFKRVKMLQTSYKCFIFKDTLEIQKGSIKFGDRVIIVDDAVATGGFKKYIFIN